MRCRRALREAIAAEGFATLVIDFKPDVAEAALAARLASRARPVASRLCCARAQVSRRSRSRFCAKPGPCPRARDALARRIKRCELRLVAPAPIARAISTAGGVAWSEIDAGFMLVRRPGIFVAGEMIDWEAPTGGYLLQACLATGAVAGRAAARWMG